MYTLKDINPQFRSIRPINLYKEWNFRSAEITHYSNQTDWLAAATESSYTGIVPSFPTLNVKYSRFDRSDTGSVQEPNYDVTDIDNYVLSWQYTLGNGDKFNPYYESASGYLNPDGSYARIVYYSLYRLFYGPQSLYQNILNSTSSILRNEAFVFDIPKRAVGEAIEPGYFILEDANDVRNLPYTLSGSNAASPYNNTSSLNPLANEGIKLIDDAKGNLFDSNYSSSVQRGNIFYNIGLVVITDEAYARYFREYLIISGGLV